MQLLRSHSFAWATVAVGYILSPLSWWNDLLVNIPLAYLFAAPFSLMHESFYLPAFVLGYWLTNLAGFIMLHYGGATLLRKEQGRYSLKYSLLTSLAYTVLIVVLVMTGMLPSLTELTAYMK